MDFCSARELLELCEQNQLMISQVMKRREIALAEGKKGQNVEERMQKALEIMRASAHGPLEEEVRSMGGLIGGEARRLEASRRAGQSFCGSVMDKAITYAMAVPEVNASMGVIVAAPTAGSCGVLPGVLFSLEESYKLDQEIVLRGMYTAGAVGYLVMRNGSVSGAGAGCQAEVGTASAMAAAAAVEMMGGDPKQALHAAVGALSNLLGLVCDPIGGLVESPCQNRNALGAVNALANAQQALAGISQRIPFDEMVQVMVSVGRNIPFELRETALGGCAAAPSVQNIAGAGQAGCSGGCAGCVGI